MSFASPGMVGEEGWTAPVEAAFLTEVASQAVWESKAEADVTVEQDSQWWVFFSSTFSIERQSYEQIKAGLGQLSQAAGEAEAHCLGGLLSSGHSPAGIC